MKFDGVGVAIGVGVAFGVAIGCKRLSIWTIRVAVAPSCAVEASTCCLSARRRPVTTSHTLYLRRRAAIVGAAIVGAAIVGAAIVGAAIVGAAIVGAASTVVDV